MTAGCAQDAPEARSAGAGAEQAHLLRDLKACLAQRDGDVGRSGHDTWLVRENRRMIRQLIEKLRQLRAGVAPAWIGLGQREAPDIEHASRDRKRKARLSRSG